ncbi:MAG: winged helix-turn-helix domain-containing protein [Rhodothermales bacterium]|nr:winged helix-turn-helix domain-containing protein [Rhodothermales bacterium]
MTPRDRFVLGSCTVDPASHLLRGADGEIRLPPRIMKVLVCLAEQAPRTVGREALLACGWGEAGYVADEALTRAISDLRKALRQVGCRDELIRTVPTVGYRLIARPRSGTATEADGRKARAVPSVRRRVRRAATAAVVVSVMGLSFVTGWQWAASPEPQVRVIRRAVPLGHHYGEAPPSPPLGLDTLLVGEDARRVLEGLASPGVPPAGGGF